VSLVVVKVSLARKKRANAPRVSSMFLERTAGDVKRANASQGNPNALNRRFAAASRVRLTRTSKIRMAV